MRGHVDRTPSVTRMPPDRERLLVERSRSDRTAFVELYRFYLPRIHAYIYRRLRDRSVTEDITATTFEKAYRVLLRDDFRNDSFGGWLYRVAGNALIDHVRRSRFTVRYEDLEEPAGYRGGPAGTGIPASSALLDDPAAEALAAAIDRDEVRRALERIPEQHRRVLVLKFFDDLSTDELCLALGCTRPTFAVKLHRALRALRNAIAEGSIDAA